MRAMASIGQQPESLNIHPLVDSIPALIHTARPDGYFDYFNKPWLEYLGVTLEKVAGWNWTAYIHPEDVDGIVANDRTGFFVPTLRRVFGCLLPKGIAASRDSLGEFVRRPLS